MEGSGRCSDIPSRRSTIYAIAEGAHERIWLGTDHGIARVDGGMLTSANPDSGLPTGRISTIVEDGDGYLWADTSAGLLRIRSEEFDKAASTPGYHAQFEFFDASDGAAGAPTITSRSGRAWDGRGLVREVRRPHDCGSARAAPTNQASPRAGHHRQHQGERAHLCADGVAGAGVRHQTRSNRIHDGRAVEIDPRPISISSRRAGYGLGRCGSPTRGGLHEPAAAQVPVRRPGGIRRGRMERHADELRVSTSIRPSTRRHHLAQRPSSRLHCSCSRRGEFASALSAGNTAPCSKSACA